ncbi:fructose-1,6-bisphosphatase [Dehalobacterium formicoaceticum]|uniref:Fructose-1,6-bisphosphatase class 3 n=2 Tax=Dehalobacterium formicoaceticum TaxID=51515 RepID=A0ABT1Y987_9FIRM|nr:fructose-1,6-bisphosphatase [Dehalobacterium formicoaceticum]MCR6546221.1 fructose-1,6-bisphosphatase [Dehalobacterium formicoaceticum]
MNQFNVKELIAEQDYLELLSRRFPTISKAATEVINLKSILNLPKGTEHFLTDLHGEYEAFNHVMNNGSGVVKRRIIDTLGKFLSQNEINDLASLIYYPEEKLQLVKDQEENLSDWYEISIYRLIQVCRDASSKYTRSKVRKALPVDFAYIIEELLHEDEYRFNKKDYYNQIIQTIVELDRADDFIIAISAVIKRLTVDHLHIIGDVYDRGPGPHIIMDTLINHHSADIQWGNHDILWMGAAAGDRSCISNVLRISLRYANMDILEEGYGINLFPLATFAMNTYQGDNCQKFKPKLSADDIVPDADIDLLAKMHKAISIIQFKLEHETVLNHPEYEMQDRLLLDKINYDDYTITIGSDVYKLNLRTFPTIDPKEPWKLTAEEKSVIDKLRYSFLKSEKLQKHIRFMFAKGSIYLRYNNNLLFHASIPMNPDGTFKKIKLKGLEKTGKELLDQMEQMAREAYFGREKKNNSTDFLWYLWCHQDSPLFGKDKMATLERYLVDDKKPHKENYTPYYLLVNEEKTAKMILEEFGLDPETGHIINGHVPVKVGKGENPIKANGKLLVIDGGFAKAYQKETGIAGYTLIYNSYGLLLASHEPFESVEKAVNDGIDIRSTVRVVEKVVDRKKISDTDIGSNLKKQIYYLEMLLSAFHKGVIKEKI